MKRKILFLILLTISSGAFAQNDSIQKERYEVINALFRNGEMTLGKNFLQYMGIGFLISNPEMIDDLLGHCFNIDKREANSFSEIVSPDEILEMSNQISWFSYYRTIDSTMLSENFTIVEDCKI